MKRLAVLTKPKAATVSATQQPGVQEQQPTPTKSAVEANQAAIQQFAAQVKGYVQTLLEKGWITKSTSFYSSPVVCVWKKDSSLRPCVDFRELNRKTVPDRHPLPRIQDLLDNLGGHSWFSILDQVSAYHQVFVDEKSQHCTAFSTPWGLYQWVRAAVRYVGRLVLGEGVQIDPKDLEAVRQLGDRKPATVGEVRALLGFLSYYRSFIQDFSRLARPLFELLQGYRESGKASTPKSAKGNKAMEEDEVPWVAALQMTSMAKVEPTGLMVISPQDMEQAEKDDEVIREVLKLKETGWTPKESEKKKMS
ncbi:hypothetical protein SRHO_G00327190 [Serrasalmus rhombeus]